MEGYLALIKEQREENDKLQEEIERLQKENQILMNSMVTEAHTKETKEIEKLNNIINELENYIRARADDNDTCSVCSVMTDDLLNILKGSDKE